MHLAAADRARGHRQVLPSIARLDEADAAVAEQARSRRRWWWLRAVMAPYCGWLLPISTVIEGVPDAHTSPDECRPENERAGRAMPVRLDLPR